MATSSSAFFSVAASTGSSVAPISQQRRQDTPPSQQQKQPEGLGGIPAPAAVGRWPQGAPVQALPWRPPATRRFLWDRTPQGPPVVSDLGSTKVQLGVHPEAWRLLQRLHQGGSTTGSAITLAARLSAASEKELRMELCTGQPGAADVPIPIALSTRSPRGDLALQASQLSAAYEVACSRQQQGAGAAQLLQATGVASVLEDGNLALSVVAALPAAIVTFRPILAKSISPQPLSRALQDSLRSACPQGPCQEGFLSMDQGRSLVPVAWDDPASYLVPLMGVWVAGVDGVQHPLVAAACIRFLCSKALADKALELDRSFLVLLYSPGKATVPLCYECHVSLEGGCLPLRAVAFSASAHPGAVAAAATGPAICKIAPLPDMNLPAVPISLGRRRGTLAAPGAGTPGQAGWQPNNQSPGSAGSITSAYAHRSALRTGESPTILPACGLPPGVAPAQAVQHPPQQRHAWQSPHVEQAAAALAAPASLAASRSSSAPSAVGLKASLPPRQASRAAQSVVTTSQDQQRPASPGGGGGASRCPAGHTYEGSVAPAQLVQHGSTASLPVDPQRPPAADSISSSKPAMQDAPLHKSAAHEDCTPAGSSGPAGEQPLDGEAADGSLLQQQPQGSSDGSRQELACEPAECSCQEEECSSSMPSFAGWSTSMQPAGKGSGSLCAASPAAGKVEPTPEALGPLEKQGSRLGPAASSDAAAAPLALGEAALRSGGGGGGAATAPTATDPCNSLGSQALAGCGPCLPWLAPPMHIDAGLSHDVVILQREVVMLRQQVQLLQCQLQAIQAMQAVPVMVASPYLSAYADPFAGMHCAASQPVLPLFSQDPAASAASVQHLCSLMAPCILGAAPAVHTAASTAPASSQGSPGAISVAAAECAGAPAAASPSGSGSGLIPAFRHTTSATAAAGCCDDSPVGAASAQEPPLGAKLPHGTVVAAPEQPCCSQTPARSCQEGAIAAAYGVQAGSPFQPAAGPHEEATGPGTGSLEPRGFTDAEADIDRLIADAERAVSALSCYSEQGSGEDPGVAEVQCQGAGAPAAPLDEGPPGDSPAAAGASLAAGDGETAEAAAGLGSVAKLATAGTLGAKPLSLPACHASNTGPELLGVVRVKVPSFLDWDLAGSMLDEDEEDEEEVERLEQKYGLARRRA